MNKAKEIEQIEKCITELVYDKSALRKAYNYYHCKRDVDQFKHLEENYGVGVPTAVTFTPLIKKHIDVLVGEWLELEPDLHITCKDDVTISKIMRDKNLKIDKALYDYINKYLQNTIVDVLLNSKNPVNDPYIEKELQRIQNDIDKSFVSEYEMAAQNIISYIRNSRDIDLKNKMRVLLTDLLIGGVCYYRVRPNGSKDNMIFDVLNPLDTFVERDSNSMFLNKSRRAVIRRRLTYDQVLEEFGDELSAEAINILKEDHRNKSRTNSYRHLYLHPTMEGYLDDGSKGSRYTPGILAGLEVMPLYDQDDNEYRYYNLNDIDVYECQWLEFDKKEERSVLHEGIKLGDNVYITRGEPEYYIKSKTKPRSCDLNINGMFFNDRNGQPFSLIAATMSLQDKYDLLIYSRDNLIASSGSIGDWIDLANIPIELGVDMPERIMKWKAYKKNGIGLINSAQEGANIVNTTFSGFDDTIKAQSIQAIQMAIDAIELQASSITGVFQQKLGQIQEREAASNVKVGIHQSSLLTKQYFHAMDMMYREVNYDLLNLAKHVYKDGLTGTIILGDKLVKTFTALPEHYTLTDYDIHIADSSEAYRIKEAAQQMNMEFIKAGMVDPEMAVDILTAKNITQLKRQLSEALKTKKAENDQLGKMQQQLEQLDSQNKEYQKQLSDAQNEIKRLQSQVEANNNAKMQIEQKRVAIEEQEVRDKKDYNDKLIEVKEKQLDREMMQMYDGNPYNDQIRDV